MYGCLRLHPLVLVLTEKASGSSRNISQNPWGWNSVKVACNSVSKLQKARKDLVSISSYVLQDP